MALEPAPGTTGGAPVLLLHGAWHASWAWANWLPLLIERGWAPSTLDLRGHGRSEGSYRAAGLNEFIDDARWAVDQFPRPPVLIGHSLGGLLIQHLIGERTFPAAAMLAPIPGRYQLGRMLLRFGARHPITAIKANVNGDLIHILGTPPLVRELMFTPDTPEEAVSACYRMRTGCPPRLFREMVRFPPPKPLPETPRLVLAATEDRGFTTAMQRSFAQRNGAEYHELRGSGHDVPLDYLWRDAAQIVLVWLSATLNIHCTEQRS